MIEIDFFGGLHGNFLCYAINSLDKSVRAYDPFTVYGTSHKPYPKIIARCGHYSAHPETYKRSSDHVVSIIADKEDCLLVNLLSYGRSGDYDFDLKNFNINFYDQLKNTNFKDTIDHIDLTYNTDIKVTNSISRGILREYYKFNFKDYLTNNIIQQIQKQKYTFDVLKINFIELYSFDSFLLLIDKIINYFDLPYLIDTIWYSELWNKFISGITEIDQYRNAKFILDAVMTRQFKEIDLNLLQESWLNARLELAYNKEMPLNQEKYFKNTLEILEYLDDAY
jgi:hypothetical protein